VWTVAPDNFPPKNYFRRTSILISKNILKRFKIGLLLIYRISFKPVQPLSPWDDISSAAESMHAPRLCANTEE